MKNRRFWLVAAALWGFAEATAFFIVPDIVLTAAVLVFGLLFALRCAAFAAIAATAGGLLMFLWGANDGDAARAFLLHVPLIGEDLLARVEGEIAGAWGWNLAMGAFTGAPYKIYAVEAGAAGLSAWAFALASFAARLARFALTIGAVAAGAGVLRRFGASRFAPWALAAFWAAIYGPYVIIRLSA